MTWRARGATAVVVLSIREKRDSKNVAANWFDRYFIAFRCSICVDWFVGGAVAYRVCRVFGCD